MSLAARLVLGVAFLVAGLDKIASPVLDVQAVQAFKILAGNIATLWAYGQPGLEIALGFFLIVGLGTRLAAIITGLLLLVFTGAIASLWARGIPIDCGCFSGGGPVAPSQTHYPLDLLRAAGLLVLAVVVAVWPPGNMAIDELALAAGPAPSDGSGHSETDELRPVPPVSGAGPGP